MTLEPESDNPNDIRTKLVQHVQVVHKMAALSSDWSGPYASSNAEYNILRRMFFVRGDTEHALCFKTAAAVLVAKKHGCRFNVKKQ